MSAVNNVADRFIKWPIGNRLNEVKQRFSEIGSFPDVIGAIDGCHISISASKVNPLICNGHCTLDAMGDER